MLTTCRLSEELIVDEGAKFSLRRGNLNWSESRNSVCQAKIDKTMMTRLWFRRCHYQRRNLGDGTKKSLVQKQNWNLKSLNLNGNYALARLSTAISNYHQFALMCFEVWVSKSTFFKWLLGKLFLELDQRCLKADWKRSDVLRVSNLFEGKNSL